MALLKGTRLGWQLKVSHSKKIQIIITFFLLQLKWSLLDVSLHQLLNIVGKYSKQMFIMLFFQRGLFEEVYMQLPPGFDSQGKNKFCRLLKSLYGLKQVSRQWNLKLTNTLTQSGFTQSKSDYSLFTKSNATRDIVIILVYVDDLLITRNSKVLIQEAKDILHHNFKMKDLGELRYFLGIEFTRSKRGY